MEKKYRINEYGVREVAVLVSGGYGAGWLSWGMPEEALFDPVIVDFIENDKHNSSDFEKYLEEVYPDEYIGGADGLYVRWIPEGSEFMVSEYDGAESLILKDTCPWITA